MLQQVPRGQPGPHRQAAAAAKRGRGQSFSAVFIGAATAAVPVSPTTGGGTHGTTTCPGTFQVIHNDRVGALDLPRGRYTITTLGGRLSCKASSRLLSRFLQDPDGKLSGGWVVLPASGEFVRGTSSYGFRVKPVS